MTIGKNRNKDRFKNWQLCNVWNLPFCDHWAINLTQNCVSSTNPYINLLAPPSVTGKQATPQVLELQLLGYSVLPLTCSMRCIGFAGRHNASVFLVLIFILARSHAAENRTSACWILCWEDASSTKSSAKSKRLILQLPTVTPSSTQL